MAKTVTISDELAAALEEHRRVEGEPTLDAAAEALIARGLAADEIDDMPGWTVDELRAAIAEGRKGQTTPWNAAEVRAEVLRRYAARKAR